MTFISPIMGIATDYGFALSLLGVLVTLTCVAIIPMLARRKRMYNKLAQGGEDVVSWELNKDFVKEAAKRRKDNQWERNKGLIIIMGVLFVVISGVFTIFVWDEVGLTVFLICMGIYVFVSLFGVIIPHISYWQMLRGGRYVFVGTESALVGRELHVFVGSKSFIGKHTTKLNKVEYNPKRKAIFINYSVLTRVGMTPYVAEVPVPSGYTKEAEKVVNNIWQNEMNQVE